MSFTIVRYIVFITWLMNQSYFVATQMTALSMVSDVRVNTAALAANVNFNNQSTKDFLNLQTNLCNSIRTALTATANYNAIFQRCDVTLVAVPSVTARVTVLANNAGTALNYSNPVLLAAIASDMQAQMPVAATGVFAYNSAATITAISVSTPSIYPAFIFSGNVNNNNAALTNHANYVTNTSREYLTLQTSLCNMIQTLITGSTTYYGLYAGCYVVNITAPNVTTRVMINEQNAGIAVNITDRIMLQNFTTEVFGTMPTSGIYYNPAPTIVVEKATTLTGTAARINSFSCLGSMLIILSKLAIEL